MATVAVRMTARAAARRALVRSWLNGAAWWLLGAGLVSLILVLIGKRDIPVPGWPALLAASLAVSVAGGLLSAWQRRLSQARAAHRLDAQLGLKDRLGSALAFENATPAGPFQILAVAEGERLAPSVHIGEAIRIRPHWTWYAGPGLLACTVLTAIYIPAVVNRPAQPDLRAQRREAAESIKSASEAVLTLAGPDTEDPVVAREIESVRQIEEELNSGASRPTEARADGARSLERIAERFEQRAGYAEELSQALRDALSRAARRPDDAGPLRPGAPESQQFNELADALKRGDLAAAQSAAAETARRLEQMAPAEREALATELRTLARAIEEAEAAAAGGEPAPSDSVPSELNQRPGQAEPPAGMPPPPDGPSTPPPPEAPKPPETPIADPQSASPRPSDPSSAQDQKRRQLQDLRRDLENAAREAESRDSQRDQPGQPSGGQPQPQDGEQRTQPGQADKPDSSSRPGTGAEPKPGDQPERPSGGPKSDRPSPQDQPQSGTPSPRPAPEPSQRQSPSSASEPRPGTQPGSQGSPPAQSDPGRPADGSRRPQQSPNTPGTPQPTPQPSPGTSGQPAPQPGPDQQPGQRQQPGQDRRPAPANADQPEEGAPLDTPDGTPPATSPPGTSEPKTGPGSGSAMEQLARRLGEAGRLAEQARRDERTAQEMRRQAEELLNRSTPEERRRLEELARQLGGDHGKPAQRDGGPGEPGDGPGQDGRTRAGGEPSQPLPWTGEQTIDARPKISPNELASTPQREAARWSGDAPAREEAAMIRGSAGERARQAARGLERAIEQQSVPGPYTDIVRRVQRRYAQRAAAGPNPSATPSTVPDAPDVGARPR
ncbi:MAG: hypothetical protein IT436_17740 [Phycisphaerales bacterium]|nr:hypothetical protein [Phycisphaerales bacterium]